MMERRILNEQLETVNQSIFYLMLIILSVFLSFWSVLLQREQLKGVLAGNSQQAAVPDECLGQPACFDRSPHSVL